MFIFTISGATNHHRFHSHITVSPSLRLALLSFLLLLVTLVTAPTAFGQKVRKAAKKEQRQQSAKAKAAAKAQKKSAKHQVAAGKKKAHPLPTDSTGYEPEPPSADLQLPPVERLPVAVDPAAPAGYFRFPIKPGNKNFLAGSMGEIRPNHFHGGIDIKTEGRTGLPVYAAADGYIARIKASAYGYGYVLYLQHPNGLLTVYGHLEKFCPRLAELVKRAQYEKQQFECELLFDKPTYTFKQGELLAYSGNTGGSGGPHLHFEVRDKMERVLNPLAFGGFPEIEDNVPPTITGLAVRPLGINSRVAGEYNRSEFKVKKLNATHFVVTDTIRASGTVGLELAMYDRFSHAPNFNGVQQLRATVNGQPFMSYVIDGVPFTSQRMVSCHINYLAFKSTGKVFQKCYLDDGNTLEFYKTGPAKGRLKLEPGRSYDVRILVADSYGNTTELRMALRGEAAGFAIRDADKRPKKLLNPTMRSWVDENLLVLKISDSARAPRPAQLFVGRTRYDLRASYAVRGEGTYLYDLRGGLPDSVVLDRTSLRFGFKTVLPSTGDQSFSTPYLSLVNAPGTLFDTLYVQTSYDTKAGIWQINSPLTPLFRPLKLTLRPETPVADPAHTAVYSRNPKLGFEGGTWNADGTGITCAPKVLGRFTLMADTTAPTIKLAKKSAGELRFKISDNLSGLAGWRCEVGGQWLLLHFEPKVATLFSEKLDPAVPLRGPVKLTVKDAMGNEKTFETTIP